MIHATRKLAREIHRRSVWQVVAVYAVVGWVALAGSVRLTDWAGLPSWTPTLALVLLLAFLPLVIATAVVQEGIPGLRIEDFADPNELPGLTPDEVHVVPEAHPLHRSPALTWRNTLLGAVAAVALLLASVVAYLTMWALGIGPVGSLLAQGVLREGDPVTVAAFANLTEDGSLGALVADALEIDLGQSGIVRVVPVEGAITEPVVVVAGDIAPSGGGYAISARIVLARRGMSLAQYREVTSGERNLLETMELLSERVREKLGESLRSIRRGERLGFLGTDSQEAMRLFTLATEASEAAEAGETVALLEGALGLDDEFALAWRALGVAYDRTADTVRALQAYRRVVDLWPDSTTASRTVEELRARIAALEG